MRTTHFIIRKLEDVATRRLIPDIEAASFLFYAEPDGSPFAIRLSNVEIPTANERACLRLQNGQQRQSKSDDTCGTKHVRSLTHDAHSLGGVAPPCSAVNRLGRRARTQPRRPRCRRPVSPRA